MQLHFRVGFLAADHAPPTLAARTDKRMHPPAVRRAAVASGMPIPWSSSADAFAHILQRRGVEPDAVVDVEAAWEAFAEFSQVLISGIEGPGDDGDCIIAQWGKGDWNAGQPTLSFGRQLAVSDRDQSDPDRQPAYWLVELELRFADDPAWSDLDSIGLQDTGFDAAEIGAPRDTVLADNRRLMHSYPQLAAMWRAQPVRSRVTLERGD
ncbi:hypothetical protein [Streptomyces sp. NBC_01304]|uniref:hypothetical protein n=1 Tax=Streptomyces sp. NBC_01304 TaxID=2903818 RepID=UPI002E0EF9B0|nr:hypothetical protein OG430_08950 [Streptomyces sp. NBC_01304]